MIQDSRKIWFVEGPAECPVEAFDGIPILCIDGNIIGTFPDSAYDLANQPLSLLCGGHFRSMESLGLTNINQT